MGVAWCWFWEGSREMDERVIANRSFFSNEIDLENKGIYRVHSNTFFIVSHKN